MIRHWPEWAKYAGADKDGETFYFQRRPVWTKDKMWFPIGQYQRAKEAVPAGKLIERKEIRA